LVKEDQNTKNQLKLNPEEAYARLKRLRQDFEKARLLIDLIRKREHLKRDYMKVFSDYMEVKIIDGIMKIDKRKAKEETVREKGLLEPEEEKPKVKKPRGRPSTKRRLEEGPEIGDGDYYFTETPYESSPLLSSTKVKTKKQKTVEYKRQGKEEQEEDDNSVRKILISNAKKLAAQAHKHMKPKNGRVKHMEAEQETDHVLDEEEEEIEDYEDEPEEALEEEDYLEEPDYDEPESDEGEEAKEEYSEESEESDVEVDNSASKKTVIVKTKVRGRPRKYFDKPRDLRTNKLLNGSSRFLRSKKT
jgi:hypothetical protein